MSDERSFFALKTPHFTIEGRSRAGHETWFRIRELGLALDIGRGPDEIVHMPHVFITHAHLDHVVGVPFYAGQRQLQRLAGGTVYVPAESADDMRAILAGYERLAGKPFGIEVAGVAVGDEVRYSRTHLVRAHAATHRIAARAYEVIEVRHHLKPEYFGDDVARLRRDGIAVEEDFATPVLFYTGDTDRGILESNTALFQAEVLLIECSFIADGHQDRAATYRHIHIDDIADFADRFENQLIVLTHFSRRYSNDEIRDGVKRRLPVALHDRIRLALGEGWQML
jgi:ribonuclease Z